MLDFDHWCIDLRLLLRQLQHVCGEINVILLAITIGLAILDYTYFVSLFGERGM
jgi:hypothetical protein